MIIEGGTSTYTNIYVLNFAYFYDNFQDELNLKIEACLKSGMHVQC